MPIYRLENTIQNYSWGSYTAISDLLSKTSPSFLPQAELWIGAHPKAPSDVLTDFGRYSLIELIKNNPIDILGEQTFRKFGDELPYLFKILAADKPLSVQVHPNKKQAIAGYNKENYQQKKMGCPERNYKDQNHKLECMCALTPLWSLNGFRNIIEMQSLIEMICPDVTADLFEAFVKEPNEVGLEKFLRGLATLSIKDTELAISRALLKAKKLKEISPIFEWVYRLANMYPNQISVFAPVILNLIQLKPGQAIVIPEGILHTYMEGVGIELMVNSDNVIRGGLTHKYIDIPELLNVTNFSCGPICFVNTKILRPYEIYYKTEVSEFLLSVIDVACGQIYVAPKNRSVEIMLCTSGDGLITDISSDLVLQIKKGDSVLVPASVVSYLISGDITVFKAGVPL